MWWCDNRIIAAITEPDLSGMLVACFSLSAYFSLHVYVCSCTCLEGVLYYVEVPLPVYGKRSTYVYVRRRR